MKGRKQMSVRESQEENRSATVFREKRYEGQPLDKYYTPAWVTRALLRQFSFWHVWEPAAGDGGISNVLKRAYGDVLESDIMPDAPGVLTQDFLSTGSLPPGVQCIVTNPPFGHGGNLAGRFCRHALDLTYHTKGAVAMLLRADFDSADGRRFLFDECHAWDRKIVLTDRIRWTNLVQKDAGPSVNHAWYVWDWERPRGAARIYYEGNDEK